MKTTFRKSMIWLHTYVGLLAGWLLFVIFLTGTLSYYNHEITHWLTNGKHSPHSQQVLLDNALSKLHVEATNTKRWQISLPDERGSGYRVSYREVNAEPNGKRAKRVSREIDPVTLEFTDRQQIQGGNFFRTFHYTLSLRQWGGRYVTGAAAMAMLIALFTGIYTHRRFFKDFFTIRRNEPKKFTIDLHAMLGVVTIPFCFVICASVMLIYISMYQPFAIGHYFDSYRALDKQVSTSHKPLQPAKQIADEPIEIKSYQSQLNELLGQHWETKYTLEGLTISNPMDNNAQLVFAKAKHELLSNKAETYALARSGELLPEIEAERTPRMVRRIFYGLHEAHFAPPALRATLFILGMMATVLIATGMVIWLQKRQAKQGKQGKQAIQANQVNQAKASYVFVEKTNNGMFYGLSLAVGMYFLCSKLILAASSKGTFNSLGSLSGIDTKVFFITWLVAVLLSWLQAVKQGKKCLLLLNFITFSTLLAIELGSSNLMSVFSLSKENVLAYSFDNSFDHSFDLAKATINFWLLLTCGYFFTALKKTIAKPSSTSAPSLPPLKEARR
ncbi:PepSY-associated TM helix domain-containing protein [Thalassotalea euphylliae]|uniref:PepSY domain-containing protein n=1 Tax=Thalassotalea euphylliae TaxID=1655234 RepID=A0A3E0UDN5_9GAMM|nr:PepSY-associated TM helix domain-containing protein [Thalassotalea euphylliae]REL34677.1 PepSY domain-containing protein [Thalassotalea euphylliae]